MAEKIMIEINQQDYFKSWEPEQLAKLSEDDKKEIIKLFVNRSICLKRDEVKCQNKYCIQEYNSLVIEERRQHMTVHHIIAKRDFKDNPQSMEKRLGYGCNDVENLAVLCKPCHKGYERAKLTLLLNGQEYRLEKPLAIDMKKLVMEGKRVRKALNKLQKGWGNLSDDERITIIYLLMKWLTVDMVHELNN